MKSLSTMFSTVWVLQAYLAVNPNKPHWADIEFTSVNGWQSYQWWIEGKGTSKVCRDPRLTPEFSEWHFVSQEAGLSVLAELIDLPQKHYLRLICRQTMRVEGLVAGYDIYPGMVVRDPDGTFPTFGGKPVAGCSPDMPKLYEEPEHVCKFCGAPSSVDPADQTQPPDYCHPEDHGG